MEKTDVLEVRFESLPDPDTAIRLLRELCRKIPVYAPRKVDKPLILYGGGKLGKLAKGYLDFIGIPILFVVDMRPEAYADDPFWADVAILKPDEVAVDDKEGALLAVCVATVPFSPLRDFLRGQGWSDLVPFYDITAAYQDLHPLTNGWFCGELGGDDLDATETVLRALSDDISRAHHLQFIAWHYLREEWVFEGAPVAPKERYFIPEIVSVLHDHEVFVDVGAYHGNSSLMFLRLVNHTFRSVIMIEPDQENLSGLHALFAGNGIEPDCGAVLTMGCAVGDSSTFEPFFEGLGYASQLCTLGSVQMEVKTIDELDIEPSFLKLHLEGYELSALKGSVATLKKSRPIIAATIYHNRQGVWELPKWLIDTVTEYVFYIRQHGWCDTGSVLYAIPKERL